MRQWLSKDISKPSNSEQMVEIVSPIVDYFLVSLLLFVSQFPFLPPLYQAQ